MKASTYRDIIAGPQADDAIPTEQEGLSVSKLNNTQKSITNESNSHLCRRY
ncbi:hypothetical protein ACOBV9_19240 (plasmid) [Pseudoalteromonas espejiana]